MRQRKIMIADSDSKSQDILKSTLSKYRACDIFENGNDAIKAFHLAHARGFPYHMIILNSELPGMNGNELLAKLREWEDVSRIDPKYCARTVIMGSETEKDACEFLSPCESYMEKPLAAEKIREIFAKMEFCEFPKRPMKTLIVEDEFVSQNLLKKILDKHGECDIAENGKEALQAFHIAHAKGKPYHLMTLDINMPDLDGYEVLDSIREWEAAADITPSRGELKILMITAHDSYTDMITSFKKGCEEFIPKPIKPENIENAIKKLGIKM